MPEVPVLQRLAQLPIAFVLGASGLTILAVAFLVRRRPILLVGTLFALAASGAAVGLQPAIVRAYPTSFAAPAVVVYRRLDCGGNGGLPGALRVLP